jgi:23S rRNA (adenine2503-C2)-methyltransferase
MTAKRTNLLGLARSELSTFAEDLRLPRFRGGQIFRWLYGRGVIRFQAMTDLSKEVRSMLEATATIEGLKLVTQQRSGQDGTTKFLFELPDGLKIESVLIPPASSFRGREASDEDEQQRLTLCVSTQVGCPLDCKFCATASMGFLRNLSPGEIVDQILRVSRLARRNITNVVFMGMGEPLMNYDNAMKAAEIITEGVGIAARRITISTAGWAKGIRQLGDEQRKVKLAVSLHSAVEATRTLLMPITKRYGLRELASAIEYYYSRAKRRVTYEHIFFDGINDSEEEVAALIKFARKAPCKINVIPFHPIEFTHPIGIAARLRPSPKMPDIVDQLREHNLTVFVRSSSGEDIDAACGQLAVKIEQRRSRKVPAREGSPVAQAFEQSSITAE